MTKPDEAEPPPAGTVQGAKICPTCAEETKAFMPIPPEDICKPDEWCLFCGAVWREP